MAKEPRTANRHLGRGKAYQIEKMQFSMRRTCAKRLCIFLFRTPEVKQEAAVSVSLVEVGVVEWFYGSI